jgi:hypothetical protein
MKYSVIYISTSPEGFEKISVGLIVVVGDNVEVRTSEKKIAVAKLLLSEKEYRYVALAVKNYEKTIKTAGDVEYLSRYSNNMIQFSPLKTIDIAPTKESKEWIYNRYLFGRRPQEERAFV